MEDETQEEIMGDRESETLHASPLQTPEHSALPGAHDVIRRLNRDTTWVAAGLLDDVARSRQNPLLLLVEVASGFDTSPWAFLCQILQPGILAQNRPSRVAVLTPIAEERESEIPLKLIPEVQIRFFSPDQRFKARSYSAI